jgi:hypothetical protein
MTRLPAPLFVALFLLGACGSSDGSSTAGGCTAARTEPEAPDSLIHVLPGAEPSYPTDPPTSGPHQGWTAPAVLNRELSRPEQVGVLEVGDVLVQYRPTDIAADELGAITASLPPRTHLAPNSELPQPVILTAWLTKQSCETLDADALARFAAEFTDRVQAH